MAVAVDQGQGSVNFGGQSDIAPEFGHRHGRKLLAAPPPQLLLAPSNVLGAFALE
eukprot:COSAG01_NODE_27893_length_674_cov_1.055652_2_plen_54_part_01